MNSPLLTAAVAVRGFKVPFPMSSCRTTSVWQHLNSLNSIASKTKLTLGRPYFRLERSFLENPDYVIWPPCSIYCIICATLSEFNEHSKNSWMKLT